MSAKIKWWFWAVVAVIGKALAWLYGKTTPQVIRAFVKEALARENSLNVELQATVEAAALEPETAKVKVLEMRADQLGAKVIEVQDRRDEIINNSRDLPIVSDDTLAALDSSRASAPAKGFP